MLVSGYVDDGVFAALEKLPSKGLVADAQAMKSERCFPGR